jgi:hypothetical protein
MGTSTPGDHSNIVYEKQAIALAQLMEAKFIQRQ